MADDQRIRGFRSREDLRERIREGDSYSLLLASIIVTYALMSVLEDRPWSRVLLGAAFGVVLLLALHTSHVRGVPIRIAGAVVGIWLIINILQTIFGEVVQGAGFAMTGLVVVTPFVVLARILRHPKINIETILGGLCSYLLIAIRSPWCTACSTATAPRTSSRRARSGIR